MKCRVSSGLRAWRLLLPKRSMVVLTRLSQLGVVFNYFWLVWERAYEGRRADFPAKWRLVQTYPLP